HRLPRRLHRSGTSHRRTRHRQNHRRHPPRPPPRQTRHPRPAHHIHAHPRRVARPHARRPRRRPRRPGRHLHRRRGRTPRPHRTHRQPAPSDRRHGRRAYLVQGHGAAAPTTLHQTIPATGVAPGGTGPTDHLGGRLPRSRPSRSRDPTHRS